VRPFRFAVGLPMRSQSPPHTRTAPTLNWSVRDNAGEHGRDVAVYHQFTATHRGRHSAGILGRERGAAATMPEPL